MATYHPPTDNDVPPLREQVGTVLIGAVAGLAAVGFHAVMNLAESVRTELAVFATAYGLAAQFAVILTCGILAATAVFLVCLLYTSPSPRDKRQSRMPSSA